MTEELAQIESEMKEKIARIKICPLLCIERYPRHQSVLCLEEACAWWINESRECGIKIIARLADNELDRRLR